MTDKELDKLFREKFAQQDFEFQESSWEKAKSLVEAEDPAVVDAFVKNKFAAQEFVFQEASWLKAQSMIRGMYRAQFLRRTAVGGLVFLATFFTLSSVDQVLTMNEVLDYPAGRPALTVAAELNEVEDIEGSGAIAAETSVLDAETQESSNLNEFPETAQAQAPIDSEPSGSIGDQVLLSETEAILEGGSTPSMNPTDSDSGNPPAGQSAALLSSEPESVAIPGSDDEFSEPESAEDEVETAVSTKTSENQATEEESVEALEDESALPEEEERVVTKSPKPSAPGLFNPMKGKSSYFGLSFGARIYADFDSRGTDGNRISPTVGIRYSYMFHPKLSLNVSGMYTYRSSTGTGHTFTGTSYSFGAHQHNMAMSSSEVHQLDFPVYLRYQVVRGHFLYAGGYLDVVMASKNTTQSATTAPYSNERETEGVEWGHMPGIRETDYGVVLGYDYRINENWQIGVRYQYGLTDWSDNQVFGSETYDRNQDVKILLEYRIFE